MTHWISGAPAPHGPADGPDPDSSGGPGDGALARAAAEGSRAALGTLYRRHRDPVYRLAYRLTGSIQDAEDVLQDVFVGLPRALERYEDRGRFRSWLLRVAARTALMRCRARKHATPVDFACIPAPSAPSAGVVERIAVAEALAAMPAALRTVFVLCEIEGYPHREAAALLDISVAASRTRLHRAWSFLQDRLNPGE